nr:hypothetical protein [Arenimonas sp.]
MAIYIKRIALALLALIFIALISIYFLLRASLPQLDGETTLKGLSNNTTIERDANGTVTINAQTEADSM